MKRGISTSFKSPQVFSQDYKTDFPLLVAVVCLSLFGLLMVYNSSQFEAFQDLGDKYYFFKQQLIWVVLGFLSLAFFSLFDYHRLEKLAVPAFLSSVILLLLVFVPGLGVSAGGAHRWLRLAGFTIQPTEIIKISSVIFLSSFFKDKVKTLPFMIIIGMVIIIIGLLQKDLGSAIVFAVTVLGIYFTAGAKLSHFLSLLIVGFLGFVGFILSSTYRKQRVLAFLDPFSDPQGFSYHISQVLIAIGSGGLFGVGVGQSRQKFAYIPEVTTDSIFSIIGEEFGFLGSVIFICVVGFLIWRSFDIAQKTTDKFGKLLASGIALWLGTQAIVNLGAMVSIIPLTGVPLPFISYGGSALLVNLASAGILLNISKQANLKKT